ncbi:hypothetical protein C0995_008972 [Termitomyces sp. Mi166|nr:hypothetical protein C0995_008972 [Termitomyces sp. Mi166\
MQSAMQCDADGNFSLDQEDDQDSLFGSPPASPVRGRSPSPGLALPSAGNSTQNVGTIALPGSQHCSELPVTPLALSLNYAQDGHPQRPPALPPITIPSGHTTPSSSRASSTGPGNRPRKRTVKNSKSKESTPRPPPPEIPLPDPSGPIPANFLRSQSALLGTAGLVGGVKPSNLTMRRLPPGTAASNPIVIDDDERVPRRSSQAPIQPSLEKLGIDPNLLPVPSTQEIISILMGQKDTLLVLQSLLNLTAETNRPQYAPEPAPLTSFRRTSRSFQPSGSANADVAQLNPGISQNSSAIPDTSASSTGPPTKKRRLNRVPAGAVDWDVPYPFQEGQGPECYRKNWGRERAKQLMSQLVTLVKDAAQKAAIRKYLQIEREKKKTLESQRALARSWASKLMEEPKVHGHYRPSTITYGLQGEAAVAARAQVQKVLTDASNSAKALSAAPLPTPSPHPSDQASTSRTPTPQPSAPFDQLILSVLAATSRQNLAAHCSASNTTDGNVGVRTTSPTPTGDTPSQGPDRGLFDNLVNILLQTFPMPTHDLPSPDQNMPDVPSQSGPSIPTSVGFDSSFFDFDSIFADMNAIDPTWYDFSIFNTEGSTPSIPGPSHAIEQPESSLSQDEPVVPQQDVVIDPILLAISAPPAPVASGSVTSLEPPPSLRSSPIPSLSSFGDVDPSTPNSASWDTSTPEVFTGSGGDTSIAENGLVGGGYRTAGQGMWGLALRNTFMQAYDSRQCDVEEHLRAFIEAQSVDKGKGRDTGDSIAQVSLPTTFRSETPHNPVASSFPSLQTSNEQRPPSKLQGSKAAIMKRAAQRKKQLIMAITNIRTQLWETTIEQGVLLHMNKLCTHPA